MTPTNTRKNLIAQYQGAIDRFAEELNNIEAESSTYVKIRYNDVKIRPLQIRGVPTKQSGYEREIGIDEIILV